MSASKAKLPAFRPAVYFAATCLTLFAVDRLGAAGLGYLVTQSDYRASRIYAGSAKADVLILGNSVANAMVMPPDMAHELHHTVFSLAAHGLDAQTQKALVEDLIDHGGAPKIAILEIRPVLQSPIRAVEFSPYATFSPRLDALIARSQKTIIPWRHIFHLYSFNSNSLVNIVQKVVDRDDQSTGPSNGTISPAIKRKWLATHDAPVVDPDHLAALEETVLSLRAAGVHAVVVAAPVNPVTLQKGPWAKAMVAKVRADLPADVPVIDHTALFTEDRYFEDPIHMNKHGRDAYRVRLVEIAKQNGL